MTSGSEIAAGQLGDGPACQFADWPHPAIPNGLIGVYTIWRGDQLIYVGMAGGAITPGPVTEGVSGRSTGLRGRLAAHASGYRSGDQFCVYVFDRLILPDLTQEQIQGAAHGRLSLDQLTRHFIRQTLSYRFITVKDAATARAIEKKIQRHGLAGQMPLLNPLRARGISTADRLPS